MTSPIQTLPDIFNNLSDEVKQWLSKNLDENPELLIEYMGISNNEIIKEFDRENNKDTETKNKELKIKEAKRFREDATRIVNQLMIERGFTCNDFEIELRIKNEELRDKEKDNDKDCIDLDSDPFIPNSWKVESHQKQGQLKWDSKKIKLYLSDSQKNGKTIQGHKLRKELEKQKVLNANLLDFLLKNPEFIPEDWKVDENGKTRYIFFWGTVYRDSSDNLCVRDLYWDDGKWRWSCNWLVYDWDVLYPSVALAS